MKPCDVARGTRFAAPAVRSGARMTARPNLGRRTASAGEVLGRESSMSFTRTVETAQIQAIPAPFPHTKGTATIKVVNGDPSLGPAVVLLRMEPGSEIARHLHAQTTETSYVLEGDVINEGICYPAGTEWNVKPLTAHGPHTTKNGCSVLVTFSYPSVLDDFTLA
jgi:hypothetical protein